MEPQRAGENEVATALRRLERVLATSPRAFQVVLADALYAEAPFIKALIAQRKHVVVVLKDDRRAIYQDVLALCTLHPPQTGQSRRRHCLWRDVEALTSWPQAATPVRVARSHETYAVRRQATAERAQEQSEWMWVTTLPQSHASTGLAVRLGHARWEIENYGFNALVNAWHADHVYKHHPRAMDAFCLVAFLAYNLFHAFLTLNLKPELRRAKTDSFWAYGIASDMYHGVPRTVGHSP